MGTYHSSPTAVISLYWAVIGLVARLRGWKVPELVVKILAHECAHAYTQLGTDIDGEYWPAENFEKVDLPLAEGLAQYYTHQALVRLSHKSNGLYAGAFSIYEGLLEYQNPIYRVHLDWIDNHTPETVRHAVLGLRRNQETTLEQFQRRLSAAQSDFNFSRG